MCKGDNWEIELMKETLKKGEVLRFRALGNSMFPWVREGDLVTVKPIEPQKISRGDIIFFQSGNDLFLHRLIKKQRDKDDLIFFTKGDNLPLPDDPFTSRQILGKLITLERGKRTINLDGTFNPYINLLIIKISPFISYFLKIFMKGFQLLQKIFLYLNLKISKI